jgi:hypothetical protein
MTKVASPLAVPIELDHPLLILPLIAQKRSGRDDSSDSTVGSYDPSGLCRAATPGGE